MGGEQLGHAASVGGGVDVEDPSAAQRLGIETLHPEQEQVIADVQAGRDVLMVLPTGFGKSACYQIPSMLLPRPVVVISPLLSLLQDQQQKMLSRDVPCVRLDGTVRFRGGFLEVRSSLVGREVELRFDPFERDPRVRVYSDGAFVSDAVELDPPDRGGALAQLWSGLGGTAEAERSLDNVRSLGSDEDANFLAMAGSVQN